MKYRLCEFAEFNPRESLPKGILAKKVAMDMLLPFYRNVPEFAWEKYNGGVKFRNGDTIMARITPCLENGKTAKVDILEDGEVGFGSTEFIVFRAKDLVSDPDYLYYLICSPHVRKPAIKSMVGSSGRQRVQTGLLEQLEIDVPPLEIQKRIGGMLRAIDDKIQINNEINENLLQQAKTIFKSWFVDFAPFDEPMVEAPTGYQVPQSLRMVQIQDIPHILETGKRPKGGAVSEGIPSVGAENVKELGVFDASSTKYIPQDFALSMKKGKILGYELLLYKDGGKPGTFIPHFSMFGEGFPYEEFYINEHVFKLDFNDRGYNEFAYLYMQTDYPYHWLANNGGKAAVPGINQQNVNEIWIYHPSHPLVQKFCKWVQPIFTIIFTNCAQNMKLSKLRDALLPKLISGELDVSSLDI